ncbi:hypothetical protein GCW_91909 [Mycoplasmoides gallisepticum S6]|uniref:Uncharacterized protein n=1 Tax=Mycoplasmoides gallisepticum S6 TaxID=1006581 RepID=A0A0F6CLX8_MYCGL|nr:hypothetical protein GCW_91909 [Mycoplasmoides gallisepticum S6]
MIELQLANDKLINELTPSKLTAFSNLFFYSFNLVDWFQNKCLRINLN